MSEIKGLIFHGSRIIGARGVVEGGFLEQLLAPVHDLLYCLYPVDVTGHMVMWLL
jgi:hypothetical protein